MLKYVVQGTFSNEQTSPPQRILFHPWTTIGRYFNNTRVRKFAFQRDLGFCVYATNECLFQLSVVKNKPNVWTNNNCGYRMASIQCIKGKSAICNHLFKLTGDWFWPFAHYPVVLMTSLIIVMLVGTC